MPRVCKISPKGGRADIVELLDDLQNTKGFRAQVNRVRSQVAAALNWAVEHEFLDSNPAAAVKRRRVEVSRDRVLSDSELRAIWRFLQAVPVLVLASLVVFSLLHLVPGDGEVSEDEWEAKVRPHFAGEIVCGVDLDEFELRS